MSDVGNSGGTEEKQEGEKVEEEEEVEEEDEEDHTAKANDVPEEELRVLEKKAYEVGFNPFCRLLDRISRERNNERKCKLVERFLDENNVTVSRAMWKQDDVMMMMMIWLGVMAVVVVKNHHFQNQHKWGVIIILP